MNLWRWKCELPEFTVPTHPGTSEQMKRNWFPRFIRLMHNRMMMGFWRHGDFHNPNQPNYDRVGGAIERLHHYELTGNGEYLVDAANLCGIEFTKQAHPKFHFTSVDDGIHTRVK